MLISSKAIICCEKILPLQKSFVTSLRYNSQSSKLSTVLNGDFPVCYKHIAEQNKTNSVILREKYDSLLERALVGGGAKGIERHVKRNKKMLIRDRIKLLLDKDSEVLELSPLAGLDMDYGDVPCAGVVTLVGKVHGVLSMIIGNDATVKSGSVYPITLKKQLRAQRIALENCLPCIYLVDSGGAFLPKQDEIFIEGGKCFYNEAIMSSEGIPQTAFVCGSCTAGGAYVPAMADEAVILHKAGTIFLGGPPLVYAATGERVTAEQLGGATLHCKVSGVTDHFARTEEEGLTMTRDIIATLNLHDLQSSPLEYDEPLYSSDNLSSFAPSKDFGHQLDARFLLACLLDGSRFHEFKSLYGPTLVTGFGFVKGRLAGFVVSDGRLTGQAAVKATHFVQLCAQRGAPIVFFQNLGRDSMTQLQMNQTDDYEKILKNASFIKAHAQLMQAIACSHVPSVAIATGGVIGSLESQAMSSLAMGSRFQFIYPNVKVGAQHPFDMAHDAAMAEMPSNEISISSELPPSFHERKRQLYEKFRTETDAFYAASRCFNDGIILPTHTRDIVGHCLNIFNQQVKFSFHLKQMSYTQPLIRM